MEELDPNSQGESLEPEAAPVEAAAETPQAETAEPAEAAPSETPVPDAAPPEATEPVKDVPSDAAVADAAPAEAAEPVEAAPSDAPAPDAAPPEAAEPSLSVEELMQSAEEPAIQAPQEDIQLKAVLEAVIYVAEEPLTVAQIAASLQEPPERIAGLMAQLIEEFDQAGHGICIREIAGGYKMATKAEHHEAVRNFVKSLKPPLKLSLPALETLAVIAYKQPVTSPEVMEIRGVQGGGVIKTLLDRKLIAVAGRKNVIGKPILYKTTKEFLIQFGLKDLSELPTLKEFEELKRLAFDGDTPAPAVPEAAAAPEPEAAEAAEAPEVAEPAGPAEVESSTEAAAQPPAESAVQSPEPATQVQPEPADDSAASEEA